MTKVIFDLEKFKEFLEEIKSEKLYQLDISESPIAKVTCYHVYGGSFGTSMYGTKIVALSGKIED